MGHRPAAPLGRGVQTGGQRRGVDDEDPAGCDLGADLPEVPDEPATDGGQALRHADPTQARAQRPEIRQQLPP